MQTLRNDSAGPAALIDLIPRVMSLRPTAERQWGAMSVAQMLWHCQQPLLVALGERTLRRSLLGLLFGRMAKRSLLGPDPWSQGMPTAKEFLATGTHEFDKEQAALLSLIQRFADTEQAQLGARRHPFFGPLTPAEWQGLQWRHLDHHLRQFCA